MASMFTVKHMVLNTSIFRSKLTSKAEHLLFPQFSSFSRASFSSASVHEQNRYPGSGAGAAEADEKEAERRRVVRTDFDDYEDEKVADEIKQTAQNISQAAKDGVEKATEAVQHAGEKAKETAKGAWETAKGATHKIKETVVGSSSSSSSSEDEVDSDHRMDLDLNLPQYGKRAVNRMEDLNLPKYGDARDAEVRDQSKLRSGSP